MEKRKSIANILASVIASGSNIIITIFAQRIFLQILNVEYLGINGLFSNIISLLGVFELGIGTAIIFNLYKPLATKDTKTVASLMNFYKKAYLCIAAVIAIVGLSLTPFLNFFIKDVTVDVNIYFVYILFIITVVCSYLLSYRRNILYADQKNYQISIVHIMYLLFMNASQLISLTITHNYYIYLIIKIIAQILENGILYIITNKQYPYLNSKSINPLNKTLRNDIFKKVRALFLHKIGGFIVLGTDNILISKFIGIIEVGLYSNYYIIINAIYTIIGQAFSAFTPSIGHVLIKEHYEKAYSLFKKTRLLNFWLSCVAAVEFLVLSQPFISLWLGKEYLLNTLTVIVLAFNVFQRLQRYSYSSFKEASGIFYEDRFVPIIESSINIIASLLLIEPFGIAGIFMGTAISDLSLWCFSYPKFVYKKIFQRTYFSYIKETCGYLLLFIISSSIVFTLTSAFQFETDLLQLIYNATLGLIIPSTIFLFIFRKNKDLKYLLSDSIHIVLRKSKD